MVLPAMTRKGLSKGLTQPHLMQKNFSNIPQRASWEEKVRGSHTKKENDQIKITNPEMNQT
eukprot:4938390-Amphidinium_carterae.1